MRSNIPVIHSEFETTEKEYWNKTEVLNMTHNSEIAKVLFPMPTF
jgi:hypothetical protein